MEEKDIKTKETKEVETSNTEQETEIISDVKSVKEDKAEKSSEKKEKPAKAKKKIKKDLTKELKEELSEVKDKYIRLAAEFDNFRRRTAKERLDMMSFAGEEVIIDLLPIVDDFERAVKALEGKEEDDTAKKGTLLIYDKFMTFLKSKGVEQIEVMGKDLNTDYHEAVAKFPVEEKEKKNKIIDVVLNGYTMKEKVIRFAKVVVGI
ncbi:MAG: nucleotide exchange factor GrpE [Bacteroidales bacterium]